MMNRVLRWIVIGYAVVAVLAVHYLVLHCLVYCAWMTAYPNTDLAYWQRKGNTWFGVLLVVFGLDVLVFVYVCRRISARQRAARGEPAGAGG